MEFEFGSSVAKTVTLYLHKNSYTIIIVIRIFSAKYLLNLLFIWDVCTHAANVLHTHVLWLLLWLDQTTLEELGRFIEVHFVIDAEFYVCSSGAFCLCVDTSDMAQFTQVQNCVQFGME